MTSNLQAPHHCFGRGFAALAVDSPRQLTPLTLLMHTTAASFALRHTILPVNQRAKPLASDRLTLRSLFLTDNQASKPSVAATICGN